MRRRGVQRRVIPVAAARLPARFEAEDQEAEDPEAEDPEAEGQ